MMRRRDHRSYIYGGDGAGRVALDELDVHVDAGEEVHIVGLEAGSLVLGERQRQRLAVAVHEEVGLLRVP
jgi:hypothetical protein